MGACQVTIDDTSYYIDCEKVGDLEQIDDYLVNTSSSSIILKHSFSTTTTYPYISCSSLSVCTLRSSSSSSVAVTSPLVYEGDPFYILNFNHVVILLLALLLGIRLLWRR